MAILFAALLKPTCLKAKFMQALILAGGLGTRLQKVVSDLPKPMAPVGGKPFLYYLINYLQKNGATEIIFLTGHKAKAIDDYISTLNIPVQLRTVRETQPLGTGGALFNVWNELEGEFFLLNGDSFFDADLRLMLEYFHTHAYDALMALHFTEDASRYGCVAYNEQYQVREFIEKGQIPDTQADCMINSGIYLFKKESLLPFYQSHQGKALSLEKEVFPQLVFENRLHAIPMGGMFIDIGIPQDYYKANEVIPKRLSQTFKPALFLDRDNVLIEDKGYTFGDQLVYLDKAVSYIKTANENNWHVLVVSNQSGIARGYFSEEDAHRTNAHIQRAFSVKGLKIDQFYISPYHQDGVVSKYKKFSYTRKPWPGMILKACQEHCIDIKQSLMVGDNPQTDNINMPFLKCKII